MPLPREPAVSQRGTAYEPPEQAAYRTWGIRGGIGSLPTNENYYGASVRQEAGTGIVWSHESGKAWHVVEGPRTSDSHTGHAAWPLAHETQRPDGRQTLRPPPLHPQGDPLGGSQSLARAGFKPGCL